MTQHTPSAQIRQLDGQIGMALFTRTTHDDELTNAGEALPAASPPARTIFRIPISLDRAGGAETT
jgi:DNA-binding transcriptional LysR family regulator